MSRPSLLVAAGAASLTLLASARGFASPFPDTDHYLPVGLVIGAAFHPTLPHGFLIGTELSYVRLNPDEGGFWFGGYVDGLWDTGASAFRFSTGPEIGWGPFGIDFGYMGQASESGYAHGLAVRPFLSVSFITLAGRYGHLFGNVPEHDFGEVVFLLKVPIPLGVKPSGWTRGRNPPPPPPPPPPPKRERKPLKVAVPPPDEEPPESIPAPSPSSIPDQPFSNPR